MDADLKYEMLVLDVTEKLYRLAEDMGIDVYSLLADKTGLSYDEIKDFFAGESESLTVENLIKIARAVGKKLIIRIE